MSVINLLLFSFIQSEAGGEKAISVADQVESVGASKIWWYWLGFAFIGLCVLVGLFLVSKYLLSVSVPKHLGNPVEDKQLQD
jgi:hypothetical protein